MHAAEPSQKMGGRTPAVETGLRKAALLLDNTPRGGPDASQSLRRSRHGFSDIHGALQNRAVGVLSQRLFRHLIVQR